MEAEDCHIFQVEELGFNSLVNLENKARGQLLCAQTPSDSAEAYVDEARTKRV